MKCSVAVRNARLNANITSCNSGKLNIYNGTRPTNPDTALSGNTLLASLTLNATSFPSASGGILTANAVTSDTNAAATGTATFARITTSGGTALFDLTVGVGTGEAQLSTLSIVATGTVSCTSLVFTDPVGS